MAANPVPYCVFCELSGQLSHERESYKALPSLEADHMQRSCLQRWAIGAVSVLLDLSTSPACALDLRTATVWSLSEDQLKIGLLFKDPARQNIYTSAMFTCLSADGVRLMLSPVDHQQLGRAISRNQVPSAKLVIDGKAFEIGPEVSIGFNFHNEEWMYETSVSTAVIEALVTARAIRAQGTGLSLELPRPDPKKDFAQFRDACPALHGMR